MAAMSTATFCSDWDAFQLLDSNPNPSPVYDQMFSQTQHDQLAASILGMDYSLDLGSDPVLLHDTFFSDQELILPLDDHEYYYHDESHLKRQKTHQQVHSNFNGFALNPSMNMHQEFARPQLLLPPTPYPEVQNQQQPAAPWYGNCVSTAATMVKRAGSNGGGASLSPQSIAARQRRRRITEKTSELGKLVPSGSKMNTAEMFQAAYKYIKFLQAQIAMLKLMDSMKEVEGEGEWMEGLQLLASPTVQEKLYSEEKCLVSKEFVETLAKNHDLESKMLLKDSNAKLQRTNG